MRRQALPTAADIMSRRPVTVRSNASITDAIRVLLRRDLSGVPVVDEAGRLVGILSERDCLRVLAVGQYSDIDHERLRSVADFMSPALYTVTPAVGLYSMADFFLTHHQRRLPVLEADVLVGLVARRDVLRAVQKMAGSRLLPLPEEQREPSLYPSATDTSAGVIGSRLG